MELSNVFGKVNKYLNDVSANYPFSIFGDEISEIKGTTFRREDFEFLDQSSSIPTLSPERALTNKLSERSAFDTHLITSVVGDSKRLDTNTNT